MQKEKLKTQKGITLIALIITIIVMLILVGVTVTVALNGGLFNTAKDAAQKTADAVKQETEMLQYEYEIAKAKGETTLKSDEYILDKKYGLKIGDKVNYDEGTGHTTTPDTTKGAAWTANRNNTTKVYTMTTKEYKVEETGNLEWRVLGINDNGQVELVSTTPTSENHKLWLVGEKAWLNLEHNLNTFCDDLYGNGKGAESARSLKAEDINELGNYSPSEYSNYGKEYWFRFSNASEYIQWSTDQGANWKDIEEATNLKVPGGTEIGSTKPGTIKLTGTKYDYRVSDKIKTSTRDGITVANLITYNNSTSVSQWLLTSSIYCEKEYGPHFQVLYIDRGWLKRCDLYEPCFTGDTGGHCVVRPVVTLKYDVTLSDDDSDGVWEID